MTCPHQWVWKQERDQYECVHCGAPITGKILVETRVKIEKK